MYLLKGNFRLNKSYEDRRKKCIKYNFVELLILMLFSDQREVVLCEIVKWRIYKVLWKSKDISNT